MTKIGGGDNSDEEDGGGFGVGDRLGVDDEDGVSDEGETKGKVQLIVVETRQTIIESTASL